MVTNWQQRGDSISLYLFGGFSLLLLSLISLPLTNSRLFLFSTRQVQKQIQQFKANTNVALVIFLLFSLIFPEHFYYTVRLLNKFVLK